MSRKPWLGGSIAMLVAGAVHLVGAAPGNPPAPPAPQASSATPASHTSPAVSTQPAPTTPSAGSPHVALPPLPPDVSGLVERPPKTLPDGSTDPSSCSDFALLAPLFGLSDRGPDPINPNHRDSLRVTGPVASGIGGGYYHSIDGVTTCNKTWALDWEVFGFSEGLDPAKTFQIGVGGGLALTVFGKFQFGLALGYDLIRLEHFETGGVMRDYSNGLLEWNDVAGCGTRWGGPDWAQCAGRNFTWLLTFGITSGSSSTSNSGSGSGSATTPSD